MKNAWPWILLALALAITFSGCDGESFMTEEDKFNLLEDPIMVIAIGGRKTVTLSDANGKKMIIYGGNFFAQALAESYEVGDVIVSHKKVGGTR